MTDRKFFRRRIVLEILSEEPISPGTDLETVIYRATHENYSMRTLDETETEIDGKEAAKGLRCHGASSDLFALTPDGEDV
jgi:hypothetical protein